MEKSNNNNLHSQLQSIIDGIQREQHLAITKTLRLPQPHTAVIAPSAKLNGTYYIFSKNRGALRTPRNNTHTGEFGNGIKIALIVPTFTGSNIFSSVYEGRRLSVLL
ncbi:MAG: hypothetical protein JO327_01960 [Nitrososphaeraceae archaeon]|nr:hypothetical protein [Nitrososphaeraceae archaeon]MBV9666875.1 hypothetical protein [Nitrososphaeraceae archaeon]